MEAVNDQHEAHGCDERVQSLPGSLAHPRDGAAAKAGAAMAMECTPRKHQTEIRVSQHRHVGRLELSHGSARVQPIIRRACCRKMLPNP